jgi:hypothetical protein
MIFRDILALARSRNKLDEKPVILIIADISGYTEFMLSTETSLLHGQTIINELIQSIIDQIKIPLKVAKLEGDAVFMYAINESTKPGWPTVQQQIGSKLITFFNAFSDKLKVLAKATHCTCDACMNINALRLKVIVHAGRAIFYRIGDFLELGGIDIIILHRLLKNSVSLQEYILMTAAAFDCIPIQNQAEVYDHEETYPAIGTIKAYLYPM